VNDPATGKVTITPTAPEVGGYATASNNLVDVDGLGAIKYQWRLDGQNLPGVTAPQILVNYSARSQLSVVASYTDGGGTIESVESQVVVIGSPPPSAN
jgi:hypothetical protein